MTEFDAPFPKAVAFDWDNTLIDNWDAIAQAVNAARQTYGLETWSVEQAREKSSRALRISFPEWFGDEWEKARDIFYAHFKSVHIELLKVLAGADELLAFLEAQNIPLFVISNKNKDLLAAEMAHLGWGPRFRAVVGSMATERDKPHPQPMALALKSVSRRLDDPSNWYVGDSAIDVEFALRSGCTPVLLHNEVMANKLGLKLSFSDCFALQTALYNQSKSKVS